MVARIEHTSLRAVAAEVGLSKSGLTKFIAGGAPYSKTQRALEHWYVRALSSRDDDVSDADEEVALAVVLQRVPCMKREEARGRILQVLTELRADESLTRGDKTPT